MTKLQLFRAWSDNIQWIAAGNTGCTFATFFARQPDSIGWIGVSTENFWMEEAPADALILSIMMPAHFDVASTKQWALSKGFYIEKINNRLEGLRYKFDTGVSWVQYFGPDAPVSTRRTPYPMLMLTIKLSAYSYAKVGINGVLHLAHASVQYIKDKVAHKMWDSSFKNTKKKLGHKPGLSEAAKTTFHI